MTNPVLDSTLHDLLQADFPASPPRPAATASPTTTSASTMSAERSARRDAYAASFLGRLERIGDWRPTASR